MSAHEITALAASVSSLGSTGSDDSTGTIIPADKDAIETLLSTQGRLVTVAVPVYGATSRNSWVDGLLSMMLEPACRQGIESIYPVDPNETRNDRSERWVAVFDGTFSTDEHMVGTLLAIHCDEARKEFLYMDKIVSRIAGETAASLPRDRRSIDLLQLIKIVREGDDRAIGQEIACLYRKVHNEVPLHPEDKKLPPGPRFTSLIAHRLKEALNVPPSTKVFTPERSSLDGFEGDGVGPWGSRRPRIFMDLLRDSVQGQERAATEAERRLRSLSVEQGSTAKLFAAGARSIVQTLGGLFPSGSLSRISSVINSPNARTPNGSTTQPDPNETHITFTRYGEFLELLNDETYVALIEEAQRGGSSEWVAEAARAIAVGVANRLRVPLHRRPSNWQVDGGRVA